MKLFIIMLSLAANAVMASSAFALDCERLNDAGGVQACFDSMSAGN